MSNESFLNSTTMDLAPYPMEELASIRKELESRGKKVFDFGTGDPRIPIWDQINETLKASITSVGQYPSIRGCDELKEAHQAYLARRFGITKKLTILPSRGSKEAIFHIALSIIGRSGGKRRILYPNPGYPVYRSSTLFAGGIPHPMTLNHENDYLMKPWELDETIIKETAAIWVNYPHNPTGTIVTRGYWEQLILWCQKNDILLLSDDCYADIYSNELEKSSNLPINPLEISSDKVLSFMSLSKRSGFTGYRAGFIAGDPLILNPHARARANFGLANPLIIQKAACEAWGDDQHVFQRRKIFDERMEVLAPYLVKKGLLAKIPQATFYLWCKIPDSYKHDDIQFCKDLASKGIITSPSSWLGEDIKGYLRFALVPETADIKTAIQILDQVI